MQKANREQQGRRSGLRKKAAAIVALLAVCATAVGGTLAWQDYKQHKSNELSGSQIKYEARLVEDFEEITDWKVGEDIKKEIRVANVGRAEDGFGDVYVRLQLKEFMQIGDMILVETGERYMVAKGGQTYTAASGQTYTFEDGHYVVFDSESDARSVFPGRNVKYLEDKVTGDKGWFIETQAGDVNGQYGKHVVTEYGFGDMMPVIPGSVFCPEDQRNHHGYTDADGNFITWSPECDYPIHTWDDIDGPAYREFIKEYIQWILGTNVIFMSDWDGTPVAAWIIDDEADGDGWAYWGQALAPGTTTSNILEKVTLINQPDGNFYYVIHTDMEALSIDEFLKPDGEGQDWKNKPKDSYVNNRPTITFGPTPSTVKAGETVQPPTFVVGPEGAAQTVTWSSSNPSIASVDPVTGVVTGMKEGGPVTIIAKAPNGAREQYSIMVTPGDLVIIDVTGVTLDKNTLDLVPGGSGKLTATVNPSNATNKNVTWSTSNSAVATVDANGNVTAVGEGTATITVTTEDGNKKATCTVTVTPEAPKLIDTIDGEGPYDMVGSEEPGAPNYAVDATINKYDFDNAIVVPGSIKLSDIIDTSKFGTNYSGVTVTIAAPAGLNANKVTIGNDKDGDKALLITYYGTQDDWEAAYALPGRPYPQVQMTLVLHADGYADTTIKVNLAFDFSIYG